MYKSFRVKNFRCFKDLQISDLGRVNLIAGKNNTGKTALMEAMYILTKPLIPQTLFDLLRIRGIEVGTNRKEAWSLYFHRRDKSHAIELIADQNIPTTLSKSLLLSEVPTDDEYTEHLNKYLLKARELGFLQDNSSFTLGFDDALLKFLLTHCKDMTEIYLPSRSELPIYAKSLGQFESYFSPATGGQSNQELADVFSMSVSENRIDELIELLNIFEPKLNNLWLLTIPGGLTIWAHVNGNRFPLQSMGGATNRIAQIYMTLVARRPQVIFIDEIENGIHHSVQKQVWQAIGQLAREQNIQVFATTHSYEMIEAAHEAFKGDDPYDFRFHRLDRDIETGNVKAVTYNDFGMKALANFDFDHEVRG